jgi:hypothetical protein
MEKVYTEYRALRANQLQEMLVKTELQTTRQLLTPNAI